MKSLFAIALAILLLIINGCSDQKSAAQTDSKEHVLSGEVGMVKDAKAVTDTLNRDTAARDAQAAEIAGH